MTTIICSCGKPTNGVTLCAGCTKTARIAVANIAAYYDDLETVRTRQTRYGVASKGSIGKTMPLGMDGRFTSEGRGTKAQDMTRNAVTTWARCLLDDRPGMPGPTHDSVRSVCAFFVRNMGSIITLPWAPEFLRDMLAAEKALRGVVDRPAEGWYAGECGSVVAEHNGQTCACACHHDGSGGAECDLPGGCGAEFGDVVCTRVLYAEPGNPYVRCRDCGTSYDVAERREWLVHEAEDREATVEVITRIITTLGDRDVRASKINARIRQWAVRGKITSHGTRVVDGRPRPLYRVGDVLELLSEEAS